MDSGDCETEEDSAPEACVSPEGGAQLPSNSREMRNRAEKMRRDKLNSYIGELAQMVPMISKSPKRMDKTSILRLTATHLRIYQTLLNGRQKPSLKLPKEASQYVLEQLVAEQLGGFLLILTSTGKIVFVSHTVEQLLGHLQTDLLGHPVFNVVAPEDQELMRVHLNIDISDKDWRKQFSVRLKKAGPRTEAPVYESCSVMGMHRPDAEDSTPADQPSTSLNNNLLVFFVRVTKPEPITERLIEASKEEYVTRHLVDGRIVNCDQRISIIAGYMSEEVFGLSAFNFMHKEDVRWVMIALRQMYDKGESRGWSCYRLLSRTGQFIYLRTFGYLEFDDSGCVESFVCVNTLVSEKEAVRLIREMKERYSAFIKTSTCPQLSPLQEASKDSTETVEDPSQIEAAVAYLIVSPGGLDNGGSQTSPNTAPSESQDCTDKTDNDNSHGPVQLKVHPPLKRSMEMPAIKGVVEKRRRGAAAEKVPPYRQKISEISGEISNESCALLSEDRVS